MNDVDINELEEVTGGGCDTSAECAGRLAAQIVGCTAWFLGGWILDMDGSVLCHD